MAMAGNICDDPFTEGLDDGICMPDGSCMSFFTEAPVSCQEDSECTEGCHMCYAGFCVPNCEGICMPDDTCLSLTGEPVPCQKNSECNECQLCENSFCAPNTEMTGNP